MKQKTAGRPKTDEKKKRKTIVATVSPESYSFLRRKENGPIGRTIDRILKLTGAIGMLLTLQSFSEAKANEVEIAGVLRMNTATQSFEILDDATHTQTNLQSVITSEAIDPFDGKMKAKVTLCWNFTATKVITMGAWVDEVYAQRGILAGPSIGLDCAVIRFNTSRHAISISGANINIYGKFLD